MIDVSMQEDSNMVLMDLASNPSMPEEELDRLADWDYWGVRRDVAKNPSTGIATLMNLAFDPHPIVKATVAENPKLKDIRDFLNR